jgi:hypothetical protein
MMMSKSSPDLARRRLLPAPVEREREASPVT